MADKFIPSGDRPFATKAQTFARTIERDPQRFGIAREELDEFARALEGFEAALLALWSKGNVSHNTIKRKDEARDKVKRMMEKFGRILRANDQLSSSDRFCLGIAERPAKLKKSTCPQTRPQLIYKGSRHSKRTGRKVHVLKFREPPTSLDDPKSPRSAAKPAGARGVEIFVELLDAHEDIPSHPGELSGGRPWFLRSYTRGPIEVEFPVADRPMRVVYWARWVGMKGDVGPFSKTCVAEFEGPQYAHKAIVDQTIARRRAQSVIITTARMALPDEVEEIEALPGAQQRLLTEEAA